MGRSGCLCMCVCVHVQYVCCVCVYVCAEATEVHDKMSCLPIMNDRAMTEGSKYFELGRKLHDFLFIKILVVDISYYFFV